jgi:hypothetical protein
VSCHSAGLGGGDPKSAAGTVPSYVRGKKQRLNIIVSGGKWWPFEGVVRLLLRGCC